MDEKVGRNDPCYCGSGLKYKKCHMAEDKEKERSRVAHAMAVKFLRQDMLKFARGAEYEEAFAAGLAHYWNGMYTIENADEMAENEAL
ncbi:MAG: SEC-C domain-containing protein, partial [Anaerolineales bacterium]|nr:SEC-C domain-containing protein [Anaerolineales bacterium]